MNDEHSSETSAASRVGELETQIASLDNANRIILETLSHDLRTPLNTIIGFADMMEQEILGTIENPKYRGYISDIRESGQGMLEILNDVLDRGRFERGQKSEKDFRQMIELAPDLISICRGGKIVSINPAGANILGRWPIETIVGRNFIEFVHDDFKTLVEDGLEKLIDQQLRVPLQFIRPEGGVVDVEMAALDYDGESLDSGEPAVMLMARDVTERNRALRQLATREEHIRLILETIGEGILTIDGAGNLETINPTAEHIFGYAPGELLGCNVTELIAVFRDSDNDDAFATRCDAIVGRTIASTGIRKDGETVPVELSMSALKIGERTIFIGALRDITERMSAERRLQELATRDPLSKMPNRRVRDEKLQAAINSADADGSRFAVMFLNMDNTRNINDGMGHAVGDQVIREVGRRIDEMTKGKHLVAHLGGDEFNVIFDADASEEMVGCFADDALKRLSEPISVDDKEAFTSVSIGVVFYPDQGGTVGELLRDADAAVHYAKRQGGAARQFYSAKISEAAQRRMNLERGLRRALENDEFSLVYQSKVKLENREIIGAEALLRWTSPEFGPVSPEEFIPVAENCALISGIGDWVMGNACHAAARINNISARPIRDGVNLSAMQFLDHGLEDQVLKHLKDANLKPEYLDMELTESMMVVNPDQTIDMLKRFSALGITVSMDDFGTGYSSLSYLTRFPLDVLKVDRAFVTNLPEDRDAVAIANSIITMARSLNLHIVAEGIETESQISFLHALGCQTGQGYLFSKPVSEEKFTAMIDHSGSDTQ